MTRPGRPYIRKIQARSTAVEVQALQLSTEGRLRRSLLLCMGLSASAAGLLPGNAGAAQFGSPAWFAQQQQTQGSVPQTTPAPAGGIPIGVVTTPDQALIHASRSIADLSRAADAIVHAQAAQLAARQLTLSTAGSVPDGLTPGGLQAAAAAALDVANPQGCAPTNTCTWQNAALPTQSVAGGQTTVTVKQTAKKAILTWDSFSIGKKTTLDFDQHAGTQSDGTNDWVALNRVSAGSSPSQILGQIKADGSVYIINQNGIIFGGSSLVNVHSLLASTLPLYLPTGSNTLTPGNDPAYLSSSNALFLNSGINSVGPGSANGNVLGLGSGQTIALSTAGSLPADISIEAGASINTGALGYSLIAAPNVYNAGTVTATDGQVILAAGVGVSLKNQTAGSLLLQPVLTGRINDDAHGNVDATPRSKMINSGLIVSKRGDARLMGFSVNQNGVVAASTSVTRPGSINIVAEDEQATDSAQARTGSLNMGGSSVTTLLPDDNDETTTSSATADQIFKPGTITLTGGSVTLADGSLVEAPGQKIVVAAIAENDGVLSSGLNDGSIAGRVYLDEGATIDAAGLADVLLEMSDNLVKIPRLGQNELADSPLQRDGPLFGASVTIDSRNSGTRSDGVAWVGTPLANVSGYVLQVSRKIQQLLQNGGMISIAGAEVIAHSGSFLNVDGGYLHYLGGTIQTTRLIAANGAVIDIASADPNVQYLGFAGQFIDKEGRWNNTAVYTNSLIAGGGVYESDYIQGGNAGTLNVYGHSTVILDGDISAQALAGRHQVSSGKMPSGGKFYSGAGNSLASLAFPEPSSISSGPSYIVEDDGISLTDINPNFSANTALPVSTAPISDPSNLGHWTHVSGVSLAQAGFSSVTLAADDPQQDNQGGEIIVAPGSGVTVQPGGTISLTGSRVSVFADLTALAGSINITTTGHTSVVGSTVRPTTADSATSAGDITIADNVVINARGEWVNDTGFDDDQITGGAFVNGGSISLQTQQHSTSVQAGVITDTTGSILLGSGSVLDVSSGGRVQQSGQFVQKDNILQGKGGNITLATYVLPGAQFGGNNRLLLPTDVPPDSGHLQLDGSLLGYGFSGGGTLTLRALGIQVGDSSDAAPDWTLTLPADFFTDKGFGAYVLNAEYDASITPGTVVRPTESNLLPNLDALQTAQTGVDLYATDATHPGGIYSSVGKLDEYHRQATDFSMFAGDFLNWRGDSARIPDYSSAGITGTALLGHGASILADAGAHITIGSDNQVTVDGSIIAHGGSITLTGDTGNGGYAQLPGLITNGNAYSSPSKSVWLGASALLDVSGVSLVNTEVTPLTSNGITSVPHTGKVLAGGTVTITNDTGYIIALDCKDAQTCGDPTAPGAQINVSGASDTYDLPANGTTATQAQAVWSDAGQIILGAGAGLYYDGEYIAHGGSDSARGGTLTITPEVARLTTSSGFTGADRLVVQQHPGALPDGALAPGQIVEPALSAPSGHLILGIDRIDGSGIDSLNLGVNPALSNSVAPLPVYFTRDVSISVSRSIVINASAYIAVPDSNGSSHIELSAPYVSLHGYVPGGTYPRLALPPDVQPDGATLKVTADNIDLGGQFSLRNFADAQFIASGDIRFVTPSSYDYYRNVNNLTTATAVPGLLLSTGDLTFQAAQVYPATGNTFIIDDVGTGRTVTFLGNDHSASAQVPLSAGGGLLVDATNIVQSGVLRAPSGQIVLGVSNPSDAATQALFSYPTNNSTGSPITVPLALIATNSVQLTDGSITSVSLDGIIVPYGQTVDSQNLQFNGSATSSAGAATSVPSLTAPPTKSISINAGNVSLDSGATVDLSGGGDLQATEWVAGTGGSRDVLSQYNTVFSSGAAQQVPLYADGRPVYAVIPGYSSLAAYDPSIVNGDPMVGRAVYLSGAPGLPAGIYTLLPAKYATLPGAYRVVQDTAAIDTLTTQSTVLPDGSRYIQGRFVDSNSGASDARSTAFVVQSGAVWKQYSEYKLTSENAFFPAQAAHAGSVTPRLPMDAGQLILAATNTLDLGATLNTAAAPGGMGAEVDIASQLLQVIGEGSTSLAGYVQVNVADLDQLNASSLLLGGTRTRTSDGDQITALSNSVVISNGDEALTAPEIILVAKADQAGDGVTVDPGSVIKATGSISAQQDVPIFIGELPTTGNHGHPGVSGDGALLRVSNGAAVAVTRINVPNAPVGVLQIGAGAVITGDASITLDSAGDTRVDPSAQFNTRALDADAGLITFVGDNAGSTPTTGLVIGAQTLAQFANAQQVTLRSRGDIDFLGDINAVLDSDLTLSTGNFVSDGGAVSITANTLKLSNDLSAPSSAAIDGAGSLTLNAGEIIFGGGSKSLSGFGDVTATATKGVLVQGVGSFDFGNAPVSLHTPIMIADTGASNSLSTTGAMTLDAQGAGQPLSAAPLGGTLTLSGGTLDVDTTVQALAGNVNLEATAGDLQLGLSALISTHGVAKTFADTNQYAAGGVISLKSDHGNVIVPAGAVLDFSAAASGGDAGGVKIAAPEHGVELAGLLKGAAIAGQRGGSFTLDMNNALDLDALAAQLGAGGVDHLIAVRTGTGNLILSSGNSLKADVVQLTADGGAGGPDANNGNVNILGSIDASGKQGGEIDLFGRSGVDVEGSLLATGSAANQLGGSVAIGTTGVGDGSYNASYGYENVNAAQSGVITLGPNAIIDVSGGSAHGLSGGTVAIRAPLLANGDVQVSLDPATQIRGARDITLEAYATWSTTDATSGAQHFDAFIDPSGDFSDTDHVDFYQHTLMNFVQAPGFTFENRFSALGNFHARPGIDLVNPDAGINNGSITVLSDWNLGAGSRDSNGTLNLDYRYNGVAPVLTLRAVGNLEVDASITDGFFQNTNPFNSGDPSDVDNSASPVITFTNLLPLLTASLAASVDGSGALTPVDSSSYRLVAGADVNSANPTGLSTTSQTGDVNLNSHEYGYFDKQNSNSVAIVSPTMIRTGVGSITVAAAHDVQFLDPAAPGVIYTAGRPVSGATGLPTSSIVDSHTGYPSVVETGKVNSEAAGNVSISAGNDVIGIEQVFDDSSRTGREVDLTQIWWPWMQDACLFTQSCSTASTSSSIDFGNFDQGIMSVGGNITVTAGRDVRDLSVSAPTTWYQTGSGSSAVVSTVGGGNVDVTAGRDILSGAYFVAQGDGRITAGRSIASDIVRKSGEALPILLAVQDGRLAVSAVQGIDIGGIYNPSYLFTSFDSQSYSADSSVSISATAGDVTLQRLSDIFSFGGRAGLNPAYQFILPSTLEVSALNGGISIQSNGELYPSATGQLSLIADGTIRFVNGVSNNTFFGLIDASAAVLPSPLNPITAANGLNSSFIDNGGTSNFDLHTPLPLHAADSQPVRIYSAHGDIIDGSDTDQGALVLDIDKPGLINAGRDIVNLIFRGQNLYASDVTQIKAGRDFYDTALAPQQSVAYVELGGPGTLDIQAGRDIGPITSANDALNLGYLRPNDATYPGIRTVGNQNNAFLKREGASISVVFGIAPGVDTQTFAQTYIDPSVTHNPDDPTDKLGTRSYNDELVSFVVQYENDQLQRTGQSGSVGSLTPQQAWTDFQTLPVYQQERFEYSVFFDVLNHTGLDFNNPNSRFFQQYARGFQAINTLFPASLGYTANDLAGGANGAKTTVNTGTFDMRGSTVQTQRGGNISILGPGGQVLVGSVSAPPVVAASQTTAGIGPNNQGILTLEQGAVSLFTDRSVLLAQSRIFTEQGGDVLIWSSNGDINAGKGAKTNTEIPPPDFLCDVDHFCVVDAKSQVSGAGIAVLQTKSGTPSGTANLIAPSGTVDAGDAGIRVSGGLNVAALHVANADNIQVSGQSVGVPTGAVDSGALGAANSVAASVAQTADKIANSRPQEQAGYAITVEVLGFGGSGE